MTENISGVGRGIRLVHEEIGDPNGTPIVLIAGLGQQMHAWPDELCQQLADRGNYVVRFDNRDAGKSTHLDFTANPLGMFFDRYHPEQYVLFDMAKDTVGLIDALGLESAHLIGMSMGGMIAQTVAARFPERVRTLTSIMSNTGAKKIGRPAFSTWRMMATGKPPKTAQEAADAAFRSYSHIGSAGFPINENDVRSYARRAFERDSDGVAGAGRQIAGIFKSGDRTQELRHVTAPTLVIHGDRDLMVNPTGGAATARAISTARLHTIVGMGHDLPRGAWGELLDLVTTHTETAPAASRR